MIYPQARHPLEVTRTLDLEPTEVGVEGDRITNSLGFTRVVRQTLWCLSSEATVNSLDLRRHLDWLLAQLQGKRVALNEIRSWQGTRVSVYCPWWSILGRGGPILGPEQMSAMASLDLELNLDVPYFGDDTDEAEGTTSS